MSETKLRSQSCGKASGTRKQASEDRGARQQQTKCTAAQASWDRRVEELPVGHVTRCGSAGAAAADTYNHRWHKNSLCQPGIASCVPGDGARKRDGSAVACFSDGIRVATWWAN